DEEETGRGQRLPGRGVTAGRRLGSRTGLVELVARELAPGVVLDGPAASHRVSQPFLTNSIKFRTTPGVFPGEIGRCGRFDRAKRAYERRSSATGNARSRLWRALRRGSHMVS